MQAPPESDYPSTRYFQIHFQHLYEMLESLKEQVQEANRQIAAQNQILRRFPQTVDTPVSADGQASGAAAHTVQEPATHYANPARE